MRRTRLLLAVGTSATVIAVGACGAQPLGDTHAVGRAAHLVADSSPTSPTSPAASGDVGDTAETIQVDPTLAPADTDAAPTGTTTPMRMPNLIGLTSADAVLAVHSLATDGVYPLVRVGPPACAPDSAHLGLVFDQSPPAGAPIDTMRTTIVWRVYRTVGESGGCGNPTTTGPPST